MPICAPQSHRSPWSRNGHSALGGSVMESGPSRWTPSKSRYDHGQTWVGGHVGGGRRNDAGDLAAGLKPCASVGTHPPGEVEELSIILQQGSSVDGFVVSDPVPEEVEVLQAVLCLPSLPGGVQEVRKGAMQARYPEISVVLVRDQPNFAFSGHGISR